MLDVKIQVTGIGKLDAFVNALGPSGRAHLHAVGANALADSVRRHLLRIAPARHGSATELGAPPTRHIENAIGSVVPHADAGHGEVVIPIPGISRFDHDIVLTTPTRFGKRFLTVPKHAAAYGRTVGELRKRGWKVFRPGTKRILLGYRSKGDKPVILYSLAETVKQRKDPSLLPTSAESSAVVSRAIAGECRRIVSKAR